MSENLAPKTRREIRERERKNEKNFTKISKHSARAALLGVLGLSTIVAPLSGLISPNLSIAATATSSGVSETLLRQFAGDDSGGYEPSGLEAVPAAAAMARLRQAASLGTCPSEEASANGDIQAARPQTSLQWPMRSNSFAFTSPYGYRIHPVTGASKLHEGVDMASAVGTPIYAIADGKVAQAGPWGGGYGIYIEHEIDGKTVYSGYLHMYSNGVLVREGQTVKAGQLIARVGNSGVSTGPHLHFEIRDAAKEPQDPVAFMKKQRAPFPDLACAL